MDIVLHALNGVFTVMIMIAFGFWMERKGWFTEDSIGLISKMVNNICLPTFMMSNIVANFTHDKLIELSRGLPVPFISMMLGYFASMFLARAIGVPKNRQAIFQICVAFSNTIFIGLPLGIALFGEEGAPYVMVYYMVNTSLFWTIGMHDLATGSGEDLPWLSWKSIKKVISPPLLGFATGVVMVLLGLQLPQPIFKAFHYIGSMSTPLAMIFIGIAISKTDWNEIHLGKDLVFGMLGRYFVCPLLVIALLPFFDLDPMMQKVFVIIAAMPAMTNISIVAKNYGGDYKYAAMLISVSTVLAIIMIPFYMWLIH